jgi:hypothetical protein
VNTGISAYVDPNGRIRAQVSQNGQSVMVGGTLVLDGLMRNTPDARRFIVLARDQGVRAAISERDGPFADYSQAPPEQQPDPKNVIR